MAGAFAGVLRCFDAHVLPGGLQFVGGDAPGHERGEVDSGAQAEPPDAVGAVQMFPMPDVAGQDKNVGSAYCLTSLVPSGCHHRQLTETKRVPRT